MVTVLVKTRFSVFKVYNAMAKQFQCLNFKCNLSSYWQDTELTILSYVYTCKQSSENVHVYIWMLKKKPGLESLGTVYLRSKRISR